MAERKWHQRYAEGIVIGILTASVLALVGYLNHRASPWFWPTFYGVIAGCSVLICGILFLLLKRIPRSRVVPSPKNIEECVHSWLDNHRVSVKNDPSVESYYRFCITLDSGLNMTVVRMRDSQDYVQILADMGIRGEDKKLLEQFSDDEINRILWDKKVELARAQVGYGRLVNPPEKFHIFRRVPIHHNLTEFAFISMVGSVRQR